MKYLVLTIALLVPTIAAAQQSTPVDMKLQTYRQLLSEANDRIVALSDELYQAKEALTKVKKPAEPEKTHP